MPDYKIDDEVYKLIVEQLDGAVVTDKDGRYVYVTKSWEDYFGITLEKVKGKYVRDVVPTTRIHEALENKRSIIGYPIPLKAKDNHQSFCNYIPIIKNDEVVAGFIYIIFNNEKKAVEFANMLNKMTDELNYYQQELRNLRKSKYNIDDIIGESDAVAKLRSQIRRAAKSTSNVLIEGETGVGKELVAHSIHDLSNRSMKPLIKVNCAAIPSELFESELFGYEHGAFTGAKKEGKQGKFELAKGGSLFLDEINQLSVVAQPKLLRVLQEKEIEKIGGKGSTPIDVRLIVATNSPLEKMVKDRKFRDDLYYRLNVISIRIPSLRERKGDIPLLVNNIIDKLNFQLGLNVKGVETEVLDKFMEYDWPGNIRELQNVIERGMNIALTGSLTWNNFEEYFHNKLSRFKVCSNNKAILPLKQAKGDIEKEIIIESLKKNNNNRAQSAKDLGISRTMLYKKIKHYNIN
ncbi:MAG: sigma 54-interacting transcriptional regulator [Sedimentibacter sp.]|uniref:sigma-54 interaction domain-containing protein n=1 Tax=Sedimentibacter sp. TaxID=1960295 RepID=UPI0031591AA7